MSFKSHLQTWMEMFSDRGTEYMAKALQPLNSLEDVQREIQACRLIMSYAEHCGVEFMYAWAKKELLIEVVLDWERIVGRLSSG